ncbi:MAG: DUF1353 domain-containing protein [Dehalococcoidales bacterium]|nr:DUF1353 domain-containing protein [Dehalococcoidales bacterium]
MKYIVLKGWKYQVQEECAFQLEFSPAGNIETDYIRLTAGGRLTVKKGYAWDGASGPAIDTPCTMRASLAHDALYQLMRLGRLHYAFRELADKELRRICREDGMGKIRAWYFYWAVRIFAGKCAKPGTEKPPVIKEAACGLRL